MDNGQRNGYNQKSNDFDIESWQKSLEISAPLDMPMPENCTKVETPIVSSETPTISTEEAPSLESVATESADTKTVATDAEAPALGQITPVGKQSSQAVARVNYNPANIRMSGDRLDKATMAEISNVENQLSQTHDLSNFYEEIRGEGGMLETNLNNLREGKE